MSIIAWIAWPDPRFIARKLVAGSGEGLRRHRARQLARWSAAICSRRSAPRPGVTGFNLYSMFVAIVGAAVVLWLYHAIAEPASLAEG